jgi:transposase
MLVALRSPEKQKAKASGTLSVHGLSRINDQLRLSLERAKSRNNQLDVRIDRLETERDNFKKKHFESLSKFREAQKEIASLKEIVDKQNKALQVLRKDKFGKKNEASPINPEPTAEPDEEPDKVKSTKPKRGQQSGRKGHGRSDRSDLDTDEIPHTLTNPHCASCLLPYVMLPGTDDSTLLQVFNYLLLELHKRSRYAPQCKCPEGKVVNAAPPSRLYPGCTIGNTLWVHIFVWKYLFGVPTNRILRELSLKGLALSQGTVTGGMKKINPFFDLLVSEIVNHCRAADLWNADETSWKVFEDDDGNRNQHPWWLWVFASSDAIAFALDESRSKRVPEEFFAASVGILVSDRFSSYKALKSEIRKAFCWVHQRRDLLRVYEGIPQLKNWSKQWLHDIGVLFAANHHRFKLFQHGEISTHKWQSAQYDIEQQLENMAAKIEQQSKKLNIHPEQKKILASFKRHWYGLVLFAEDPRVPMDNNRAERLLRGPVVFRKNTNGSGSEWGGHLAAKMFSIFNTWVMNKLNPEKLLLDFFEQCSKTSGKSPPDVSDFLPWKMSAERKLAFALPKSYS